MPSASAWATQARSDARMSRWVAAGQAVTRIATPARAAATRAALLRNAAATRDGLRAGGGLRCREAAPDMAG